uniref:Uncharacterized protein n=1 Tax=Desulfovibrio sp. U5L TaxID=596152 RepID=I2PXE9_9BACT
MKIRCLPIAALCCLLACVPALASKHAPAKSPAHPKSQPAEPKGGDHETVEAPGKVIKEPNSFHGIKWGTPMSAIPDLTMVEKDGQAAYATVQGVVYRIGDAFLSDVVYGFCQDKFAAVMVEYKGRKAHETIRNFLAAKYTKPMEADGNPDALGWPIGNVLIRMEFSAIKDTGILSYFYQPFFTPCSGPDGKAPQ